MNKGKKLPVMIVLCIMTLFVSGWVSSSSAAPAPADPKETVMQAYQKLLSLKSYHMNMDTINSMSVQGRYIYTVMNGDVDLQTTPLLSRSNMSITIDFDSKEINKKTVQYIEESGDKIIVYSYTNNQWIKQSLPKGSYNPLSEYENYIKGIKSVTIKDDNVDSTVFEVVVKGSYLKENIKQSLASMGMAKMVLSDDFLKDIDDLTYSVTIDKNTGTISKMEIDLSDFMSKFGNNLVDSMPIPEQKKSIMKEMFSSMKIVMNITLSQFNSVEKFTIPQEVKEPSQFAFVGNYPIGEKQ
jgi:hypothetical protein